MCHIYFLMEISHFSPDMLELLRINKNYYNYSGSCERPRDA